MTEREENNGIPQVWEFPQKDQLKYAFIQDKVRDELSEMHSLGISPRSVNNFLFVTADTIYYCSELLSIPGPALGIGSGRADNGLLYDALSSWKPDGTHTIELSPQYLTTILTGEWRRFTSDIFLSLRKRILYIPMNPQSPQVLLDWHPANIISHELHHGWNKIEFPEQSRADGEFFASGDNKTWMQTPTERGACEFSKKYLLNYLSFMDKSRKNIYFDLMLS